MKLLFIMEGNDQPLYEMELEFTPKPKEFIILKSEKSVVNYIVDRVLHEIDLEDNNKVKTYVVIERA